MVKESTAQHHPGKRNKSGPIRPFLSEKKKEIEKCNLWNWKKITRRNGNNKFQQMIGRERGNCLRVSNGGVKRWAGGGVHRFWVESVGVFRYFFPSWGDGSGKGERIKG